MTFTATSCTLCCVPIFHSFFGFFFCFLLSSFVELHPLLCSGLVFYFTEASLFVGTSQKQSAFLNSLLEALGQREVLFF
jgi:hypothetical protein